MDIGSTGMPSTNGEDKYALTSWTDNIYQDVTVPSGQVCQVKKIGIERLLEIGVLKDLDTLNRIVNDEHIMRVKPQPNRDQRRKNAAKNKKPVEKPQSEEDQVGIDMLKLMTDDPESFTKAMRTVDRVVCHIVVQPHIELCFTTDDEGVEHLIPDSERKPATIYSDFIDIEDKTYLFARLMGGQKGLEQFREKLDESVRDVGDGEVVSNETVGTPGD